MLKIPRFPKGACRFKSGSGHHLTVSDRIKPPQNPPSSLEIGFFFALLGFNGRAYKRTALLPVRRETMQRWAEHLDKSRIGADLLQFNAAQLEHIYILPPLSAVKMIESIIFLNDLTKAIPVMKIRRV